MVFAISDKMVWSMETTHTVGEDMLVLCLELRLEAALMQAMNAKSPMTLQLQLHAVSCQMSDLLPARRSPAPQKQHRNP